MFKELKAIALAPKVFGPLFIVNDIAVFSDSSMAVHIMKILYT